MKLSMIVPTLNRLDALQICIESLRKHAPACEHEIIVIDGGSADGTPEWLLEQHDLVVLQHNRRRGCVKAFNDGFRISSGDYCAQLSDDVEFLDNCLDRAVCLLDNNPEVGQVVIPHIQPGWSQPNLPYVTTSKGRYLFAAFGVTRRVLGERLDWWGEYYHQQGDPELSLKVVEAGYKVVALEGTYIVHRPGPSEMRKYKPDAELFHSRWGDWSPPK